MSGVVETDKGYYVIRLDSEFDQKATDEKKDEIIGQRQQELYQKVCDEYTSDFKFDIDKKVWKQVKFEDVYKRQHIENCIVESRGTLNANTYYCGDNGVKVVVEHNERYVF